MRYWLFPVVLSILVPKVSSKEPQQFPPELISAFLTADKVELISLRPTRWNSDDRLFRDQPENGLCHDFPILGSASFSSETALQSIRQAIKDLVQDDRNYDGSQSGCFRPRHCIRIRADGVQIDLLICYQCRGAAIYREDRLEEFIYLFTESNKNISNPKLLNQILKENKVPLPPPPEKIEC